MSVQPRNAKIFAALLISMTAGIIILMALGSNPPSAGAFCLSKYNHLEPVENAISSRADQSPKNFNFIEIYYSSINSSGIEPSTSPGKLSFTEDINCHFVIGNKFNVCDGQIQSTEKWQKQQLIISQRTKYSKKNIRICIITDDKTTYPTDFQRKRTEALVELLCRKFEIKPEYVHYPKGW